MESDTTEQLTHIHIDVCGASQVAQWKRIPPAMQETWIRSLDREDPLEEGMATHSCILAWKNPMDRGAWWATVHGFTKSQTWLTWLSMLIDVCMPACMHIFIHSFIFFCSYVLHLEARMSMISHSSLSLAVRSYLLEFSLGFLKEPRRSNYFTGGPLQWWCTSLCVRCRKWDELDMVLRAQWTRCVNRQQIVTQSVSAMGVYVVSVRPRSSAKGQWNLSGLWGCRQDSDGFRGAALAVGPRGCQAILTGWVTWGKGV